MFTLLKQAECYSPEFIGKRDILIASDKIVDVSGDILPDKLYRAEVIDCRGKIACPGFIDQHVHISGGGGESGPQSIIGPLMAQELFGAGITTVVGVLGADAVAKSMAGLLMKARALESDGLTTFIYCGNYGVPPVTITGRVLTDVALIEKVIGVGEIAISDHRSASPTLRELMNLAYEAHTGGLLGNKAGVLHLHLGNGKEGLGPILELLEESDYPISMFVPTHLNRSRALFRQALSYWTKGGNMDLTAGESTVEGIPVPECLKQLVETHSSLNRVTVSSDGNGSGAGPDGNGIANVLSLAGDFRAAVLDYGLPLETVLEVFTTNVAGLLKLSPFKGRLAAGSDADILLLDQSSLKPDMVFAKGCRKVENGIPNGVGKQNMLS